MATQDGAQEMVVVFDASGSTVEVELGFDAFQALVARRETLCSHAASLVRAAYVQVAAGLAVRAVVFFQFRVDEEGRLDPTFNLPLEYMASNAGLGPDLGLGRIRMASRAQCPVPWHAINLWEPATVGDAHAAQLVQKAVWRNRLGLKPAPVTKVRRAAVASATQRRKPHEAVQELDEALGATAEIRVAEQQRFGSRLAVGGGGGVEGLQTSSGRTSRSRARGAAADRARGAAADRASVATDGGLTPPPEHLRSELQRQQQSYLDQIKACREEIQKLKSSLRHERERNRRLQQLLRGDV
ncbi:MAG: hypothetical protein RIB46_12700 [Pseudomonadales bacterium]